MRNKYTKEFETFIKTNVSKYTKAELINLIYKEYNLKLTKEALRRYLNRHKIQGKYIDYNKNNVRTVYKCPVGTERITKEGVFVKVAQPDNWKRKTRVIYEKHHNCKLKAKEYIIFLNQNNNDFNEENLLKVSKKEIAYLHNKEMFSKNPQLTKLGVLTAKLMIKAKEVE